MRALSPPPHTQSHMCDLSASRRPPITPTSTTHLPRPRTPLLGTSLPHYSSHKYGNPHGAIHASCHLAAGKVALYGRQVLEGLRFLKLCGLPCVHTHSGNVLLDKGGQGATVCRISEFELALLGAVPYGRLLALPRLSHGSRGFKVSRDVIAFGHLLYEMLTSVQLTERELSSWRQKRSIARLQPGPPAAWAILAKIFLPSSESSCAPSLLGKPALSANPCLPSARMYCRSVSPEFKLSD